MKLIVRAAAVLLCAALAFSCTSPGLAQGETSTVTGLIVEQKNALAIAGATVLLSRDGAQVATTRTDSTGRFTLSGVTPGIYDITIRASGFAPTSNTNVVVT